MCRLTTRSLVTLALLPILAWLPLQVAVAAEEGSSSEDGGLNPEDEGDSGDSEVPDGESAGGEGESSAAEEASVQATGTLGGDEAEAEQAAGVSNSEEPAAPAEPAAVAGADGEAVASMALPRSVTFAPELQERARFNYVSDRSFDGDLGSGWFIGNRARVGLRASFGSVVGGFFQLQDVRHWGSEVDPDTGDEGSLADWVADGLDVHQAYGEISTPFGLSIRVGRQEIGWNAERLLGIEDWSDQGRAFDAVRVRYDRADVVGMEVLYAKLLERPTGADDSSARNQDMHLIAAGGGPRLGDGLLLDGLVILRLDPSEDETMATFGVYAKGQLSLFTYELEGYGQAGTRGEQSLGAYLVGLRLGVDLPVASQPYIGGGVDLVSGDDDLSDSRIGAFDTLYGSNHNFYGHMDLYEHLGPDTRDGGLIDGQLNLRLTPVRPVSVELDAHVFAGPWLEDDSVAFHGVEVDMEVALEPLEHLRVGTGVWAYFPGKFWGDDARAELGAYLTTDFHFN